MDRMRWRFGETSPVAAAVDPETVVAIGDLLFLDGDDVKPASMLAANENGVLREDFAEHFLGIAMQRSPAGETTPVRIATTGVFELDCDAMVVELGERIGVAGDGERLQNQRAMKVETGKEAIGRIARRESSPVRGVLVAIVSGVMGNGVR